MRKLLSAVVSVALLLLPLAGSAPVRAQQNPPSNQSFVAGRYVARNYNYTGIRIFSGNTSGAGAATFSLSSASIRLPDGRTIVPFSAGGTNTSGAAQALPAIPITVGSGTTKETVTPTAITGCYIGAPQGTCQITATFNNAHGQGEVVTSGSCGIQESINDAGSYGGGVAEVDASLNQICGTATVNSDLAAAIVVPPVSIEDTHLGTPQYWNPTGGTTTLAAPATLTSTTVGFGINGANTTGGFYVGTNTYNVCISYVDLMGQEGPCSATFSGLTAGTGSTNQIGIAAPAASAGAVGYTVYITLNGGSYGLNYKVPLATYANGVATGNGVCTLTTIETTTAACAVASTSYGQSGSNAVVSALTVNTSPINPQSTVVSSTSQYVPNAGGRTTYIYAPSSRVGIPGVPMQFTPFTISAAAGTTVPTVLGTVNLPAGILNIVGRTIEVCGYATTSASTATIENIQVQWDARGQNTAGAGVLVSNQSVTLTASSVLQISFCTQLQGTVTSAASVTGGSVQALAGYQNDGIASLSAGAAGTQIIKGSTASLNLFEEARINIIYLHTTGTEGTALTLNGLTIRAI